ncbi:hypothetical protein ACJX0J_041103, partial [Zea mays]
MVETVITSLGHVFVITWFFISFCIYVSLDDLLLLFFCPFCLCVFSLLSGEIIEMKESCFLILFLPCCQLQFHDAADILFVLHHLPFLHSLSCFISHTSFCFYFNKYTVVHINIDVFL